MKMSDEEVQACVIRAEEEYEMLKDRCHDLYDKLSNSGIIAYIKKEDLNRWVAKYFDKDLISIDDLIGCIEELDDTITDLNQKIEDMKQDIEDNYRPLSVSEQVGITDKDFY